MFTGLIEQIGRLCDRKAEGDGARLAIECSFSDSLVLGESIAIDGACLTVESRTSTGFTAFASQETLRRTTLGSLAVGQAVNLERALAVGDRLGGHLVQGHVDATGTLRRVEEQGTSRVITVSAPDSVMSHLVEKGSIAVDGISLTVASLQPGSFTVWIIPETWERTTLSRKGLGDPVNLECDLIAKYVFRYLDLQRGEGSGPAAGDAHLGNLLLQGGWAQRDPSTDR